MLNKVILIFFGGAVGAATRELLMLSVGRLSDGFPVPIFLANLAATFLIGLVVALATRGGPISEEVKLFLTTGLTGGLSTFSSLIWGTISMSRHPGTLWVGVAHLVLTLVLGLILAATGFRLGTLMARKGA